MTIRTKRVAQSLVIAFDFTDALERLEFPHADYTSLLEAGLTIYRSEIRDLVVFVTVGGGSEGQNYLLGVRATLQDATVIELYQTIYVSREVVIEAVIPFNGVMLVSADGSLLAAPDGTALQI